MNKNKFVDYCYRGLQVISSNVNTKTKNDIVDKLIQFNGDLENSNKVINIKKINTIKPTFYYIEVGAYSYIYEKGKLQLINKTKCDMCGKTLDMFDEQENFCFDKYIGYGSLYDYLHIKFNLCCDCLDKVLSRIILELKTVDVCEYYKDTSDYSLKDLKQIAKEILNKKENKNGNKK